MSVLVIRERQIYQVCFTYVKIIAQNFLQTKNATGKDAKN